MSKGREKNEEEEKNLLLYHDSMLSFGKHMDHRVWNCK